MSQTPQSANERQSLNMKSIAFSEKPFSSEKRESISQPKKQSVRFYEGDMKVPEYEINDVGEII